MTAMVDEEEERAYAEAEAEGYDNVFIIRLVPGVGPNS